MKRLAAGALAAAALTAAVISATAGGQAAQGRTIQLTELAKGGTFGFVDNPPRGTMRRPRFSPGDSEAFSSVLADASGRHVGRLNVQCTVTGGRSARTARVVCTGVFGLPDGTLAVTASLVGEPSTVNAAVTGGTGAYVGARGQLMSVSHRNGSSSDTIQLLP
jgi:hypothetical protein